MPKFFLCVLVLSLSSALKADFETTPFLEAGTGLQWTSGSDLSNSGRSYGGQWGSPLSFYAGILVENGIEVAALYSQSPHRVISSDDGLEDWNLRSGWLGASIGYRIPLDQWGALGLRLSAGPAWMEGDSHSRYPGDAASIEVRSSATTAWLPEAMLEMYRGNLGWGMSLGWLIHPFNEIRYTEPGFREHFLNWHQGTAQESPATLQNGGFTAKIWLRLYLERPL